MTVLPRIHDVIRATAEHFRISPRSLTATGRGREISRARQIAMAVSHDLAGRSLTEIGRMLGNRDHTTVLHGVRLMVASMETDDALRADVEAVRRRVEENYLDWLNELPAQFQPRFQEPGMPAQEPARDKPKPEEPPLECAVLVRRAAAKVSRAYERLEAARYSNNERACLDQLVAAAGELHRCIVNHGGRA